MFEPIAVAPPQYILDAMGGGYDQDKYRWDQDTMSLVERRSGGGSYSYANVPDPSQGTDVVMDLGDYNRNGPSGAGTRHFAEGEQPFIGFPDGGPTFVSADPDEIAEYKHDARTRNWQGVAQVGALVGLAALGGSMGSGGAPTTSATGNATVSGSNVATGVAQGAAPGTASSVGFGAMTGLPSGAGIAAAPLTGGTVAAGAGAAAAGGLRGFGAKLGNFVRNNKDIVGSVIGGVGDAMAANAERDTRMDLLREQANITAGNYRGADPGRAYRGLALGTSNTAPSTRFERYNDWDWDYDPQTGRIVKVYRE